MQQSSKLLWVPITFFFWPPIGKCGCIKYATQFTCSQDQHDVSPLETQLTICIPYLKSSDIAWSAGSAFCPWCHLDSYHLVNRNKMVNALKADSHANFGVIYDIIFYWDFADVEIAYPLLFICCCNFLFILGKYESISHIVEQFETTVVFGHWKSSFDFLLFSGAGWEHCAGS